MINRILRRYRGIQRQDGVVESKTSTPAFSCRDFAWENQSHTAIIATSSASGFSEDLLASIVRLTIGLPAPDSIPPLGICQGLESAANPRMAYLVATRPPYHRRYATWDRELAARTVVVFPAYHSEFGGQESPEVYDELVHSRTHILEWDRSERPQIWVKAVGASPHAQGWSADEFLLADPPDVERLISGLIGPTDRVVIRNYRHQEIEIRRDARGIFLVRPELAGMESVFNATDLRRSIHDFVYDA